MMSNLRHGRPPWTGLRHPKQPVHRIFISDQMSLLFEQTWLSHHVQSVSRVLAKPPPINTNYRFDLQDDGN